MSENLKVGKPDTTPDAPAHVKGTHEGNSEGNYRKQRGHRPDGTATAARSTGINPKDRDPIDPSMPNIPPG